jgi:hypothetical protein
MANIKSAVESFVSKIKKQVSNVPKEKVSFESLATPNPLMKPESFFMKAMEHNDPQLREMFQNEEFTPELNSDMEEALSIIDGEIRWRLMSEIISIVLKYRAYFNEDPGLIAGDVVKIIGTFSMKMADIIAKCDEEISDQVAYREDFDNIDLEEPISPDDINE